MKPITVMKRILQWLSDHRYFLCMNPKGWTEEDEAAYQKWARQQPPIPGQGLH